MRPTIVIALACAALGCAGEKEATSTTTLTAAEATALTPPAEPVHIDPGPPIDRTAPIEVWRTRYPHAARVLDEWKATYPRAASRIADWSAREPLQLEVLVMWSVTRPHDGMGVFMTEHASWETLGAIARDEPEALAALLHWARRSRSAAEELAVHPGGLASVAR